MKLLLTYASKRNLRQWSFLKQRIGLLAQRLWTCEELGTLMREVIAESRSEYILEATKEVKRVDFYL